MAVFPRSEETESRADTALLRPVFCNRGEAYAGVLVNERWFH